MAEKKRLGRKKLEYDDIPKEYILDYDHYQNQEISVAEIAENHWVSRKTVYKYFKLIAEHDSDPLEYHKRGRKEVIGLRDHVQLFYQNSYERWKKKEQTITEIANLHGNSRTTIYKYFQILKEINGDK
ncbi:MAG: hypothetical protein K2H89_08810 [Oscillospiraceae bacterium]|nr:hypothetical protein [Oscillospiraceae bacterium]